MMNLSILSFWLFLIVCYLLYITPKVFFNKLMKRISILQKKKVFKLKIMCFCVWIEHFFMNRSKSHTIQPFQWKFVDRLLRFRSVCWKFYFSLKLYLITSRRPSWKIRNYLLVLLIFNRFSSNLRFEYFKGLLVLAWEMHCSTSSNFY